LRRLAGLRTTRDVLLPISIALLMRAMRFGSVSPQVWWEMNLLVGSSVVVVLASYIPARRAMRVDPLIALR